MKRISKLLLTISYVVFVFSCDFTNRVQTVSIERIDTSGIYFSYEYLGEDFSGEFPLEITHDDFTSSDSLRIKINKNYPEKFKFVSVVHRVWSAQDEFVSIGNITDKDVYGYNQIDKKPLFFGAKDEYENDSLLLDFFIKNSTLSDEMKLVGSYILIDKNGNATLKKAMTQNEDEQQTIKLLVSKLPMFSPPVHNGDSVTVNYLIEIPIYK